MLASFLVFIFVHGGVVRVKFCLKLNLFHICDSGVSLQGWRSGENARLPPMCPGFYSRNRRHMWVEFVVGSLLCSERFFSGHSGFPLSSKTNISKFQFDLDSRHFNNKPLALVIAQVLPVFDVKFTFTFISDKTNCIDLRWKIYQNAKMMKNFVSVKNHIKTVMESIYVCGHKSHPSMW